MQQEDERLPVAAVARVIPEDPAGLAAAAAVAAADLAVAVPTKEEVEGA
jgi:hypothetical protein